MDLVTKAKSALQSGVADGNTWVTRGGMTMVSLSNTELEGCIGEFEEPLHRAVYGAKKY